MSEAIMPARPVRDASGFTKREEVASRNLAAMLSAGLPVENRTISEAIRAADMLFTELERTR